jgi:hypothetical protein
MGQYLRAQTPTAYNGNSALFLAVGKPLHPKSVMMGIELGPRRCDLSSKQFNLDAEQLLMPRTSGTSGYATSAFQVGSLQAVC